MSDSSRPVDAKPVFPGFSSPAVGPEDPLEMLSACHERVQRQCVTLERLVDYLQHHAVDATAAEAAAAVIHYFEKAAPNHHADEEVDLFPCLKQRLSALHRAAFDAVLQNLQHEHDVLEQQWPALRAQLTPIAAQKPMALDADLVHSFVSGYRAHMHIENAQVFPLAREVLTPSDQQALGWAMSRRRGLII